MALSARVWRPARRRFTRRGGLAEPRAAAGSLDDGEAKVCRAGVRECRRGANTPCPRVRRSPTERGDCAQFIMIRLIGPVVTGPRSAIRRGSDVPNLPLKPLHCLKICLNCTQLHTTHVYMCTTRPGARCAPMSHGDRTLRSLRRCRSLEASTRSRRGRSREIAGAIPPWHASALATARR